MQGVVTYVNNKSQPETSHKVACSAASLLIAQGLSNDTLSKKARQRSFDMRARLHYLRPYAQSMTRIETLRLQIEMVRPTVRSSLLQMPLN